MRRTRRSWTLRDVTRTPTISELVAAAKATIDNLDPEEVERAVDAGDALLVDIREHDEVARHGSIPGAVHAPRGMLEWYADPTSPYYRPEFHPDRRTIVFCTSGGRSALAVKSLQSLGYSDVAHLDCGMNGWRAAGRPTSTAAPSAAAQ